MVEKLFYSRHSKESLYSRLKAFTVGSKESLYSRLKAFTVG